MLNEPLHCGNDTPVEHGPLPRKGKLPAAVCNLEKELIREALVRSNGNQRLASQILGITERMLGYRLQRYGLRSLARHVD